MTTNPSCEVCGGMGKLLNVDGEFRPFGNWLELPTDIAVGFLQGAYKVTPCPVCRPDEIKKIRPLIVPIPQDILEAAAKRDAETNEAQPKLFEM